MDNRNDEKYESFLKLYRANESCISRYVLALCPNYSAAEDIVQETMLAMWRKFDSFEVGTNFAAWGMQIARFCAYNYFRKVQNEGLRIIHFDNAALDNISLYKEHVNSNQQEYLEALEKCTAKLPEKSRKMVTLRYAENMKVTDISQHLEKTLNSTYKAMSRIHNALMKCIENRLAKDGI